MPAAITASARAKSGAWKIIKIITSRALKIERVIIEFNSFLEKSAMAAEATSRRISSIKIISIIAIIPGFHIFHIILDHFSEITILIGRSGQGMTDNRSGD